MSNRNTVIMHWIIYGIVALVGVLIAVSVFALNQTLRLPPVPVSVSETSITPEQEFVCPGDLLWWTLNITYHEAPLLMEIDRHIRNLDSNRLLLDHMVSLRVPQEETGTFARRAPWRVPELEPGNYRIITTTWHVTDSELLQYYVEFEVREDCETNY